MLLLISLYHPSAWLPPNTGRQGHFISFCVAFYAFQTCLPFSQALCPTVCFCTRARRAVVLRCFVLYLRVRLRALYACVADGSLVYGAAARGAARRARAGRLFNRWRRLRRVLPRAYGVAWRGSARCCLPYGALPAAACLRALLPFLPYPRLLRGTACIPHFTTTVAARTRRTLARTVSVLRLPRARALPDRASIPISAYLPFEPADAARGTHARRTCLCC